MSTFAASLAGASSTAYATPSGYLFVIRCVPDIFTGERINVGVCGIAGNGQRRVKVVTEPTRLQCLYGDSAMNVLYLAEAAQEAAIAGAASPSPQILFDEPVPYYNATLEEIVDTSFADQVTVALPHRATSARATLTDEDVQKMVSNLIKERLKLAADFLANTPQVIINTERGPRAVHIPLQPANGVGTIRSAFYAPQTLRTHLMDSVLDLDCAARYRKKRMLGLFILRPPNLPETANRALDGVIDSVAFRSPPSLHLEVSSEADELAELVTAWGEEAEAA
jgi:hypothetical protein